MQVIESEKCSKGLTRRRFLKTTAVFAGAAALADGFGCISVDSGEAPGGGAETTDEQIFNGTCRPNCFSGCQLNVHVREGNVVKTSMAPFEDDPSMNRICLRGLSQVANIYDPDRVKYPMKRAGARGEDKWERISWDEAITEIAEKFTKYQKEFGPQSVAKWVISGNYGAIGGGFYTTFFNAINASSIAPCVDIGNAMGLNRVVGWAGVWTSNEACDLVNAKTIFVWGNNITDAQVQEWHFVADAIEAGAKLIVIDPIFTQLAAKADMFVPVRPASDAALILSMMYVLITENLINEPFLLEHTVAPFLVKEDDGMFLRMSDLGIEPTEGPVNPATGQPTTIDPIAVWDMAQNKAVPVGETEDPALEGHYSVDGFSCNTAYTLLRNEVMQYPPEIAAKICEVPADTIVELAHLAADGPVTHRVGWGPQAYDNGIHPHHAGISMVALLGQIGYPGAGYGPADINGYGGFNSALTSVGGTATSPAVAVLLFPEVMLSGKFKGEEYPLKAAFVYNGNPLTTAVNTNGLIAGIEKLEFLVTADSMFTDTARYSDIVLPCAQFFEYEDVLGSGQHNHIIISEKAIDPPFEARPDTEIVRMLAEKMGLGGLFPATDSEWLQQYIDTETSAALGISYEDLKEKKCIRWAPERPIIRWKDNAFLTPSGRMEFYVERPAPMQDQGQTYDVERERLPRFFPPGEAWPDNPLHEKYPFVLMSERPRFRVHSQWFNNKILRELDPEPTVKMNPADAVAKGFTNGEYVECFNDIGHAVAKLVLNEAIKPGTLVYPKSWQLNQHLAGGWSELLSSRFDPVAVNQSFMDVLCDVRVWEGGN
jgi:anaerobic selenocysteine-containing dehydrogenase